MKEQFFALGQHWLGPLSSGFWILAALLLAIFLRAFASRLIRQIAQRHGLPLEFVVGGSRVASTLIYGALLFFILDRLGVSSTVLWTAITGFTTVAAVAFFAAWSVLSNFFCAILLYATRPFRLHDEVEILDGGDKPGIGGRVIDIHMIHTTLEEALENGDKAILQVPNSLFFQRILRVRQAGAPTGGKLRHLSLRLAERGVKKRRHKQTQTVAQTEQPPAGK